MQHQQKKNKNKATKDLLYRFAGLDEDARDLYASMEEDPASSSTALRLSKNASSSSSSSSSTTFLTLDDLEAASLSRCNNNTTKVGAKLKRSYSSNDSDKLAARTSGALCPSPSLALRACLRLDLKKEEYQSFVFSIRNKAWHPGDVVPISVEIKGRAKKKIKNIKVYIQASKKPKHHHHRSLSSTPHREEEQVVDFLSSHLLQLFTHCSNTNKLKTKPELVSWACSSSSSSASNLFPLKPYSDHSLFAHFRIPSVWPASSSEKKSNAPSYDSRLVFVVNHGCAPVYVKGKAELPLVIVEE
ncbi:hypothetical protein QOT17_004291 [Balamuthia mandrillaris]